MLETIREFALELLRNGGRDLELAPRHEGYFLSLALEAEPQLRGSDPRPWFDRLEIELSNLRAAIDSSLAQGRVVVSLRLVSAWARLWEHRGYWREGRAWLDAVLARSNTMRVTERAAALLAAGTLTGSEGETALSRSLLEQAVELARDMGDRRTLALALTTLAWVAVEHGVGVERSVALGDEGLAVARDLGDPWVLAESLSFLSSAYRGQSLARADALMEEGLKLRRSMGDVAGIADSLNNLGFAAITGEDYARAAAFLEESHELAVRLDDRPLIVLARDNLALIELFDGDLARAEELFRETLRLCWKIGDRRIGGEALIGLAGAAARRKEWDRAAWLAGASTGLAREGERRWNEAEARIDGRYLPDAREALGDRPYDTSFERGRAATFEEAVAFALEGDGGG
jgi:tetratricopeptide (TPR) repeat protein